MSTLNVLEESKRVSLIWTATLNLTYLVYCWPNPIYWLSYMDQLNEPNKKNGWNSFIGNNSAFQNNVDSRRIDLRVLRKKCEHKFRMVVNIICAISTDLINCESNRFSELFGRWERHRSTSLFKFRMWMTKFSTDSQHV